MSKAPLHTILVTQTILNSGTIKGTDLTCHQATVLTIITLNQGIKASLIADLMRACGLFPASYPQITKTLNTLLDRQYITWNKDGGWKQYGSKYVSTAIYITPMGTTALSLFNAMLARRMDQLVYTLDYLPEPNKRAITARRQFSARSKGYAVGNVPTPPIWQTEINPAHLLTRDAVL